MAEGDGLADGTASTLAVGLDVGTLEVVALGVGEAIELLLAIAASDSL